MTATEPTQGPCGRCRQLRPLWQFVPQHTTHWHEPSRWVCPWCVRTDDGVPQQMLCARCWSAEATEEAETPMTDGDRRVLELIARGASAIEERQAS